MWLTKLSQKPDKNRRSFRGQVLRGFVVGLLLIPTLLMMIVVGVALLGYRSVSIQGTSMEPALHHGDALWTKRLAPAELKVGDIVCLDDPIYGVIVHRVISIQPSRNGYLLETKGDANYYPERWEIGDDEPVVVSLARVRFAGYVLEYLDSIFIRVLLIGVLFTVVAVLIYRKRFSSHRVGKLQ